MGSTKKTSNDIFIQNELKAICGKNNKNILILAAIIFLSLLGLGHSIGGLKYLKKRMDNPFTKWVNLPINQKDSKERDRLMEESPDSLKINFDISSIEGYCRDFFYILNDKRKTKDSHLGRSISNDEELLDAILLEPNILYRNETRTLSYRENSNWIIIKEDLAKSLGYTVLSDINHVKVIYRYGEVELILNIPVLAIVRELPDLVNMVVPETLHELYNSNTSESDFVSIGSSNIMKLLSTDKLTNLDITPYLGGASIYGIDHTKYDNNGQASFINTVYLNKEVSFFDLNTIIQTICSKLSNTGRIDNYFIPKDEIIKVGSPHYLAFNFDQLNKVRKFKNYILQKYKLDISMNQVEDKENFAVVVKLTTILAGLLFLISIVAGILFVVNLLINHLDKIKPNLGTLKAFGLSNKIMIKDYMYIILLFVLQSAFVSYILCLCYMVIGWFITLNFSLVHWTVLVSGILFFGCIYIVIQKILKINLEKTPGDLIYNR